MTIVRRHFGKPAQRAVGPEALVQSILKGRYCFENFMMEPLAWPKGSGQNTYPAGTDLAEILLFTGRNIFEYTYVAANTDAFVPTLASEGGYDWGALTTALNQGQEIIFGGLKDAHPRNFVGSAEDWFARILLIVEDASGIDLLFGARKVAAYQSNTDLYTGYAELAGIRLFGNSGSTDAVFTIITLSAGGTDLTETTPTPTITGLEDATAVELEVRSVGNVLQFFVNGVRVAPNLSPTPAAGTYMTPCLRMTQTTDASGQVKTLAFECGLLEDRADSTLLALAGATA